MLFFYQSIQGIHNPILDFFFISISFLGSEPIYILLLSMIFWNVDKRFGIRLAILFLCSMSFNSILKNIFLIVRPIGQPGIRSLYTSSAGGYSFPSGHSQGAATFYPYLWQFRPKLVWKICGLLLILTIGFSRLYLGVHWPVDVLGGYILGWGCVLIFQVLDKRLFKIPFSLPVKLALAIVLPLLFLPIYHSKEGLQMIGFIIGLTAGYFLEDHFLDYRERTKLFISLFKTLLGLATLGLWFLCWYRLTSAFSWFYLPISIVGGLWTSIGAPYIFRLFGWEDSPLQES
ncbi:MAG: phosphatase PAP2 family protein [Desulfitobacteriaceae bacterium]